MNGNIFANNLNSKKLLFECVQSNYFTKLKTCLCKMMNSLSGELIVVFVLCRGNGCFMDTMLCSNTLRKVSPSAKYGKFADLSITKSNTRFDGRVILNHHLVKQFSFRYHVLKANSRWLPCCVLKKHFAWSREVLNREKSAIFPERKMSKCEI